jgi:hypothetical protein
MTLRLLQLKVRRAFSTVTLSMLFKEIYTLAAVHTSSHSGTADVWNAFKKTRSVAMGTIRELIGYMGHLNNGSLLRSNQ